jgi:hypothetical protein
MEDNSIDWLVENQGMVEGSSGWILSEADAPGSVALRVAVDKKGLLFGRC